MTIMSFSSWNGWQNLTDLIFGDIMVKEAGGHYSGLLVIDEVKQKWNFTYRHYPLSDNFFLSKKLNLYQLFKSLLKINTTTTQLSQ